MNPYSDQIILALTGFAFTVGIVLVYARFIRRIDILDPIFIFSAFFALFVIPLPFRTLFTLSIEGDVTPHLNELLPYMADAVWWSTAAYAVFALMYWSPFGRNAAAVIPHPPVLHGSRPVAAGLIVALIALALLVILGGGLAGLGHLILLGYSSSAETFGQGYLAVGFPWLVVVLMFVFYQYAIRRKVKILCYALSGSLVVILMFLVMGNRSMVMYLIMAIVLYIHVQIRRIELKKLLILSVSGFLILNVYGYLRSSDYSSLGAFWTTTTNALQAVHENDQLGKGAYYTLTSGEFVVPFETMPQMIKSAGSEIPFEYGKTFIQAPAFFIPSVLYPDRPLPLTNWYMNVFYDDGSNLNQGRAFFFLSEGYLNCGPAGVLMVALFWGIFLGALVEYRRRGSTNPGVGMIYALTIAFIPRGIAGSFSSILVGLPEQSLSAVVVGVVAASLGAPWVWRFRNSARTML